MATTKKKRAKRVIKRRIVRKKPVRKSLKRKPARTKPVSKKPVAKKTPENVVGVVTHYFPKVRVGVVKLKAPLASGEMIKIKGYTTDFTQSVTSIQIDHVPITTAKKGLEIGLLVNSRVRKRDIVYKL